jgi:hypothetical protein
VAVLGDSMRHPICSFAWRGIGVAGVGVCAPAPAFIDVYYLFGNVDDVSLVSACLLFCRVTRLQGRRHLGDKHVKKVETVLGRQC